MKSKNHFFFKSFHLHITIKVMRGEISLIADRAMHIYTSAIK